MVLPAVTHASRPRPVAFVLSLLVAWLVLALAAIGLLAGPIEDDLAARATEAVRRTGATDVVASADGTEVTLHGSFPSAAAAAQARQAAEVSGVSSVRLGDDVLIATRPAEPVVLAVAAGGLTVRATVPDLPGRAELFGAAAAATTWRLSGDIRVDPDTAAPAALPFAELVAALTGTAGPHTLTVDATGLTLTGAVADDAARAVLTAAVSAALEDAGAGPMSVDDQLVVDPAAVAADARAAAVVSTDGAGAATPGAAAPAEGSGTPAGSGAGAEADAAAARAALAEALAGRAITFPVNGTLLSAEDRAVLDGVAQALRSGTLPVVVAGFTDASGPRSVNLALSMSRAEAVAAYLVSRGVPAEVLRAVGLGPDQPVADNATEAGRAANRRVEITPAGSS